jgi:ketosteroid isomerase-like protein
MDREHAAAVLARMHAIQRRFYAGEAADDDVRALLTDDVVWTIPGDNAIAGTYRGRDEVLDYFARRRDLASRTFRMHPGELLVGDGDHVAVLTDGSATIDGREHHWSTVGLYRLRGEQIAACSLLALDQAEFDAIWRFK